MKNKLFIAIALMIASVNVGAESPTPAASEVTNAATTAANTAIENLHLAENLLKFADENKDPYAALVAARILLNNPGGQTTALPKPGDLKTLTQMSVADVKKLDTEKANALARPRFNLALATALKYSDGDAAISTAVAKTRAMDFQIYPATCFAYNTLGASFYWMHANRQVARYTVMEVCRANTPWGQMCIFSHCT